MVKDINEATDSNPDNISYFSSGGGFNYAYAVLNNVAYFIANDDINGSELWRSDGTEQGTYMLKNINPGSTGSSPTSLITSGNFVYFIAYSAQQSATLLWRTDGTKTGTISLITTSTQHSGFFSVYLINVNGTAYFTADGINGSKLMKTNGTVEGTTTVIDFGTATESSDITNLCAVNNKVYFYRRSVLFNGLYVTDGTENGTTSLTSMYPNLPTTYVANNGKYYFTGPDYEPWISDGTAAGTKLLKEIRADNIGSWPDNFLSVNNLVCFTATDETHGNELWVTNGRPSGTTLLKDITPGIKGSVLTEFTVAGSNIFFLVYNAAGNTDLWKTDGTSNGTVAVKTFTGYLPPAQYLADANGLLYFQNYTKTTGYELWKSDGTETGTALVKDIYNGISGSSPKNFTSLNNSVLFSSTNGVAGTELWITDGKASGTKLVKDINQTSTAFSTTAWSATPFKNKLYFNAFNQKDGSELWTTDGTAANTTRFTNIEAGSANGIQTVISKYFTTTNRLYFEAKDEKYGNELWSTDGTNYSLVKDITAGRESTDFPGVYYEGNKKEYASIDSVVYFVSGTFYSNKLWKTTGKNAIPLKDGAPIAGLTANEKDVYFNYNSNELWKTNGTVKGTVRLNNATLPNTYSYIPSLISFKNRVYYQSGDHNMWVTDGTDAGTVLFKNINPQFDDPYQFSSTTSVEINGILYFAANDGATGNELWKTDGTTAGTILVKDINAGNGSAFENDYASGFFTRIANSFYFTANDGIHGTELWKSDGTKAGTKLVKDITRGSASSQLSSLIAVGNKVAFLVYDAAHSNNILWQSDGTKAGTIPVNDNNLKDVLITNYFGSTLSVMNNQLYFAGITKEYGKELWTGTLSNINRSSNSNLITKDIIEESTISVSPSPAKNYIQVKVISNVDKQQAQLQVTDAKGSALISSSIRLNKGLNNFSYNISSLSQGLYITEIILNDGKKLEARFIKQ